MLIFARKKIFKFIGLYALVSVVCVIVVFPFYWIVLSSLTPQQIFEPDASLFTLELSGKGYIDAFARYSLSRWLFNSSLVAIASVFFSIVISCFAAYGLSRFNYTGRFAFTTLLIVTQMIPFAVWIIPLYIIFRDLHLMNSLVGLVVAYITFAIPLCTLLLKGFFDTIPKELEEAALVDGCGRIGGFLRVALPLALPGIAVTSLFAFLQAWNEYVFAATLLQDSQKYTVSIGLYMYIGEFTVDWISLLAASVVITIPTFVVFAFIQKGLIKGISAGALKG